MARRRCVTVSARSVACTPGRSRPVSRTPITSGMRSTVGTPNITVCGLEPADAPAEHADPVDHRRVTVGAQHDVGHCPGLAIALLGRHHRRQLFQVDGVHDPCAGRVDVHPLQRRGGPAQEAVALGIAAQFVLQVQHRGIGTGVGLDGQRVIHGDIHRQRRVQQRRVGTGLGQRVTHRRNVDQGWRAGRVMHQHAAGLKGDFRFAAAGVGPGQQRGHRGVTFGAALVAQHVFQQQPQYDRQRVQARAGGGVQVDAPVRRATDIEYGRGRRGIGVFHDRQFAFTAHKMQSWKPERPGFPRRSTPTAPVESPADESP